MINIRKADDICFNIMRDSLDLIVCYLDLNILLWFLYCNFGHNIVCYMLSFIKVL